MRKCPDCAEENINESLFCKHCGRCLLAPDPEKSQWSTATHTEHHKTHESIDFYDGHIVKNSRVASAKAKATDCTCRYPEMAIAPEFASFYSNV